jgi:hypothetical protein
MIAIGRPAPPERDHIAYILPKERSSLVKVEEIPLCSGFSGYDLEDIHMLDSVEKYLN